MTSPRLELSASPPPNREDELFPQIAGSLICAAAADALGWITEFVRGPDHLRKLYKTDQVTEYRGWQKTTGGRFNAHIDYINKGEYSDDTQLTLAVARSLRSDGAFDAEHFAHQELPLWLGYARGAGSSITAAARGLTRKSARWNRNFYRYAHRGAKRDYRDAGGNGAAMRVGPLALANLDRPETLSEATWMSSVVTHGHPTAIVGALLYAHALRLCIYRGDELSRADFASELADVVGRFAPPQSPEFHEWLGIWNRGSTVPFEELCARTAQEVGRELEYIAHLPSDTDSIRTYMDRVGCFRPDTKGSGTATVLAAIVIFLQAGGNVRRAVTRTINQLGSDTDTIGSFVGGLCGARHGYEAVPHEWASELQDYDYLMRVAMELARIASGSGMGGHALLPEATGELAGLPDVLSAMKAESINAKERVYHPVLGPGWVESVDVQQLRRKDGGHVLFVRVNFDVGQSCKFKEIRLSRRGG
jgi:ADP-ribosylglycohydrolase